VFHSRSLDIKIVILFCLVSICALESFGDSRKSSLSKFGLSSGRNFISDFSEPRWPSGPAQSTEFNYKGLTFSALTPISSIVRYYIGGEIDLGGSAEFLVNNELLSASIDRYSFGTGVLIGDPFYIILGLGTQAFQISTGADELTKKAKYTVNAEWGDIFKTIYVKIGVGICIYKKLHFDLIYEKVKSKNYISDVQAFGISYDFGY
jgi:hypothetical protein